MTPAELARLGEQLEEATDAAHRMVAQMRSLAENAADELRQVERMTNAALDDLTNATVRTRDALDALAYAPLRLAEGDPATVTTTVVADALMPGMAPMPASPELILVITPPDDSTGGQVLVRIEAGAWWVDFRPDPRAAWTPSLFFPGSVEVRPL